MRRYRISRVSASERTSSVTLDKVEDAFKGEKMELIQSNLSKEQEASLRDHFGAEA
jgi:uncharacterized membrane protein